MRARARSRHPQRTAAAAAAADARRPVLPRHPLHPRRRRRHGRVQEAQGGRQDLLPKGRGLHQRQRPPGRRPLHRRRHVRDAPAPHAAGAGNRACPNPSPAHDATAARALPQRRGRHLEPADRVAAGRRGHLLPGCGGAAWPPVAPAPPGAHRGRRCAPGGARPARPPPRHDPARGGRRPRVGQLRAGGLRPRAVGDRDDAGAARQVQEDRPGSRTRAGRRLRPRRAALDSRLAARPLSPSGSHGARRPSRPLRRPWRRRAPEPCARTHPAR